MLVSFIAMRGFLFIRYVILTLMVSHMVSLLKSFTRLGKMSTISLGQKQALLMFAQMNNRCHCVPPVRDGRENGFLKGGDLQEILGLGPIIHAVVFPDCSYRFHHLPHVNPIKPHKSSTMCNDLLLLEHKG